VEVPRQDHWVGMLRTLHFWSRFVLAVLVLAAAVFGSLRAYVEYEAHRAGSMLAEASRVQIGDREGSVLAMVQRYDGFRWTPEPLPPKEQWIDKDEYDYQRSLLSDHKYELAISPFGSFAYRVGRLPEAIRAGREAIPMRLRPVLGMGDWSTRVELSIREGRVQSLSAMTFVEGRVPLLEDITNPDPRTDSAGSPQQRPQAPEAESKAHELR
jgi:hypothetical protein